MLSFWLRAYWKTPRMAFHTGNQPLLYVRSTHTPETSQNRAYRYLSENEEMIDSALSKEKIKNRIRFFKFELNLFL